MNVSKLRRCSHEVLNSDGRNVEIVKRVGKRGFSAAVVQC